MKPTSYKYMPSYGQAQQQVEAVQSNTAQAVKTVAPAQVEAQFYQQGLNRSIELGYLGLQKEQFEKGLAEQQRQFDVGMGEQQRQFGISLDLTRDQLKYQRRQDNRAEILAMANIGVSIGFGYLQYKQQRRQMEMWKLAKAKGLGYYV